MTQAEKQWADGIVRDVVTIDRSPGTPQEIVDRIFARIGASQQEYRVRFGVEPPEMVIAYIHAEYMASAPATSDASTATIAAKPQNG